MTDGQAVVVSTRRLLVDALTGIVEERLDRTAVSATSGDELSAVVESNRAILVILDLESPGDTTVALATALEEHTGRRCGVYDRFTAHIAERAFELGIGVPISLGSPVDALVEAFGAALTTHVTKSEGLTRSELDRLALLTPREMEVMQSIARGNNSIRTATLLGITPHTVDTHRRRAMRKLDVSTQARGVALMARAGALA